MTDQATPLSFWESRIPFLKKAILVTIMVITPFVIFFHYFQIRVGAQTATCLPWKYYLMSKTDKQVKKGEYVAFEVDKRVEPFFKQGMPFAKLVVAVAGDHVVMKDGVLSVNGKEIKKVSRKNLVKMEKQADDLDRDLILKEGELWGMGTHPDSFGSMYWGKIYPQQVIGQIYPIY